MANDGEWDRKMKAFLKKTGEDFKRFGSDVKQEAQRLMAEVNDPARQQKMREGLKEVGDWAKKTADEVANLVETGVKKAEGALGKASDRVTDFVTQPPEPGTKSDQPPPPAATPPSPPPVMDDAPDSGPVKKTVGPGKKKPAIGSKKAAAKKTIGRK